MEVGASCPSGAAAATTAIAAGVPRLPLSGDGGGQPVAARQALGLGTRPRELSGCTRKKSRIAGAQSSGQRTWLPTPIVEPPGLERLWQLAFGSARQASTQPFAGGVPGRWVAS